MPELDAFERSLEAAFRSYGERGVAPVDAAAFADQVTARSNRPIAWPWLGAPERVDLGLDRLTSPMGMIWLFLVAALVLALAAGLLFAGGRLSPAGWERLDLPGGGSFSDLAAGPGGYVAVGQDADGAPAAWTSNDCRTWAAAAVDGPRTRDWAIVAVSGGGPGYVAVGRTVDTADAPDPRRAMAWTSVDGRTWHRVPGEPFGPPFLHVGVSDLAEANGRLVAVGYSDAGSTSVSHAAWTSIDGVTWQSIDPLDGATPGFFSGLTSVVAGARGFVATGEADAGIPIWISPDGLSWTRVQAWSWATGGPGTMSHERAALFSRLWTLAGREDGRFLALGYASGQGPAGPAAATSDDGSAWAPIAVDGLDVDPTSVVATDDRYVVVGPHYAGYPGRGAVFTSIDGRSWIPVADSLVPEATALGPVRRCGDDLIVAGMTLAAWPATWLLAGGATPGVLERTAGSAAGLVGQSGVVLGTADATLTIADPADATRTVGLVVSRQRRRSPHDGRSRR